MPHYLSRQTCFRSTCISFYFRMNKEIAWGVHLINRGNVSVFHIPLHRMRTLTMSVGSFCYGTPDKSTPYQQASLTDCRLLCNGSCCCQSKPVKESGGQF